MKARTAELEGSALDWAVATALGYTLHKDTTLYGQVKKGWWVSGIVVDPNIWVPLNLFDRSTGWGYGGSIIDEHDINVLRDGEEFRVRLGARCFVTSRLGDDIEVPDELMACSNREADASQDHADAHRPRSRV